MTASTFAILALVALVLVWWALAIARAMAASAEVRSTRARRTHPEDGIELMGRPHTARGRHVVHAACVDVTALVRGVP